ncbi:hypothetical protein FRB90_010745, partial [Tulasnella sp. 427]
YLEEYCRDHATKEAIVFFLIVLTDLKQVLDFLYDHDILKNQSAMHSMLKAKNLMFDHLERVVVGPPAQDSTDLLLSTDAKQEEFQVWELVVKAADSEELLEQFEPPDPYEVEDFVNMVDLDDVSIGSGSVVAADKLLHVSEDNSRALDEEWNSSNSDSYGSVTKLPKRIPKILRTSRRKREEAASKDEEGTPTFV